MAQLVLDVLAMTMNRVSAVLLTLAVVACTDLDPTPAEVTATAGLTAPRAEPAVPHSLECGEGVTVGFDEAERRVVAWGVSVTGDADEAERLCQVADWTTTAFACDTRNCERGCSCELTVDGESLEDESPCEFDSIYGRMIAFKKTGMLSPGQRISCSACELLR